MQMTVLNDAQIASVSLAANAGEVEQNTIAVTRADNAQVRSFAQDLVTMHTAAVAREMALATSAMIVPADNQVTQTLQMMSQSVVTRLQSVDAAEFDQMYLNSQADLHQMVLTLIDDTLLPQVTAAPLRDELTSMRATVAQHLERARALLTNSTSNMP